MVPLDGYARRPAAGLLARAQAIAAELATLTHTPWPMGFLNRFCRRPAHEKPFLLLVAGYPASDATTQAATRIKKPLDAVVRRL